jgi:hypothetical protein
LRAILRGLRVALIFTVLAAAAAAQRATADTFEEALAAANQSNPRLNSQRAATPASDEGVGIARLRLSDRWARRCSAYREPQ